MPPQELIRQLITVLEETLASGEELPDELQGEIADILGLFVRRQPQEPQIPTTTQQTENLQPGPFPSSNVNAFKYDPKSQQLVVKFHGKDSANSGPIYGYKGVPEYLFDIFRRGAVAPKTSGSNRYHTWHRGVTPSLGASMAALIKNGGFAYQRLT